MQIDNNLDHLFPPLRTAVVSVIAMMDAWCAAHWPGHTSRMSEGFRSQARQVELFAQGRTAPGEIVTDCDGVKTPSEHQTCMAADIVGVINGELTWDCPDAFWAYLTHAAHACGLQRTMDYSHFVDLPHVQWPMGDKATYSKAGVWKLEQGLK